MPLLPARAGDTVQPGEEGEVLLDGQVSIQRKELGHVADARLDRRRLGQDVEARDPSLSRARPDEAREHLYGRGLPRAVRSQEPEDLALEDLEGDVVDGDEVPEAAGQLPCHHRRAHAASAFSTASMNRSSSVGAMAAIS